MIQENVSVNESVDDFDDEIFYKLWEDDRL